MKTRQAAIILAALLMVMGLEMPRIIRWEDGTLNWLTDDGKLHPVESQYTVPIDQSNPPPLPPVVPDVSPVNEIRRQAVRENYLSPEATEVLYNTRTRFDTGVNEKFGNRRMGSYFTPLARWMTPGKTPEINIRQEYAWSPVTETWTATPDYTTDYLTHELAHKWRFDSPYSEDILKKQPEFFEHPTMQRAYLDYGGPETRQNLERRHKYNPIVILARRNFPAEEAYATLAESPLKMTVEQRSMWYPNFFDEKRIAQRDKPDLWMSGLGDK